MDIDFHLFRLNWNSYFFDDKGILAGKEEMSIRRSMHGTFVPRRKVQTFAPLEHLFRRREVNHGERRGNRRI